MTHTSSAPSTSSSALSSSKGSSLNDLQLAIKVASRSVRITIVIGITVFLVSFGAIEGIDKLVVPHSPEVPPSVTHLTCLLMAAVITHYGVWSTFLDAYSNLADLRDELWVRYSVERAIDEAQ